MDNDTTHPMFKRCYECGEEKPATAEFFGANKKTKDGLAIPCKSCRRAYRKANADKIQAKNKAWNLANRERKLAYMHDYVRRNREHRREYNLRYRAANLEKLVEYQKQHYQQNREAIIKQSAQYDRRNREAVKARRQRYAATPHGYATLKASRQRRKARVRNFPIDYKGSDWQKCLDYWHYCCAVCGAQLRDLFNEVEPHADHWIPLNSPDCPGTVPGNMICLCNTCNCSKGDKAPEQWLISKFGKRKAAAILSLITRYFEWMAQIHGS